MTTVYDECIAYFSAPDAIMRVDIGQKIIQFMQNGGQPEILVKLLSDNYRGYAQMADLVGSWLVLSGMTEEEVKESIEQTVKDMIIRVFNADRAQAVFEESSTAPIWLNEIIKYPTWRSLIYQLSEEHKNCLLLSFALKQISDGGFQEEIAHVTTAANQLEIYSSVLARSISRLAGECSSALNEWMTGGGGVGGVGRGGGGGLAISGQHTYLYARALLNYLAIDEPNMKRIADELSIAAEAAGRDVFVMDVLCVGGGLSPVVVTCMSNMTKANHVNDDIDQLYNLIISDSPPPLMPMRDPRFLDTLLSALFGNKDKNIVTNAKLFDRTSFVLAYLVSAGASTGRAEDDPEFQETLSVIKKAAEVCQDSSLNSSNIVTLYEAVKLPVVSMGVIQWLTELLGDYEFFEAFTFATVPPHLTLLDEIARMHVLLRPRAFTLLKYVFQAPFHLEPQNLILLRRMVFDRLLFLLSTGYSLPVLEFVSQCADIADTSLVAYFAVELATMVTSPMSTEFVNATIKIIGHPDVLPELRKKPACHDAIALFLSDAVQAVDVPVADIERLRTYFTKH